MTLHSDLAAPRKPRRLGLIIPWAVAIVLVIGWSVAWFWLAGETGRRVDAEGAALRAGGWQASWTERTVSGYPFRLDVDLTDLRLADPSGWALALPSLKAEAYVFAPTNWIIAVPNGLTFTRPDGGPVAVTARRLRFSLNSWDQHPPRLSLEGEDVTFTTAPGAKPFSLASAKDLQVYTRAGPGDQGAMLFTVTGGAAAPETWLDLIGQGKPVALTFDATFTHADALRGPSARDAARSWTLAGGALDVQDASVISAATGFDARRGHISLSDDGRLIGELDGVARNLDFLITPDQARAFAAAASVGLKFGLHRREPTGAEAAARDFADRALTLSLTGPGGSTAKLVLIRGPRLF